MDFFDSGRSSFRRYLFSRLHLPRSERKNVEGAIYILCILNKRFSKRVPETVLTGYVFISIFEGPHESDDAALNFAFRHHFTDASVKVDIDAIRLRYSASAQK